MAGGLDTLPFVFQDEVLKEIEQWNGRCQVNLDMGLGKTFIALKWMQRHPECWPALVICPASVKFHWEFEANHYIGQRASICESRTPPRFESNGFHSHPKLTIINQDILKDWLPYLKRLNLKTIIVDEAQGFIHDEALRTQALREITQGKKYILPLSGTPLTNRPIELWPILSILWPHEFNNHFEFTQRYCARRWTPWGWNTQGASNLDELNRRLKHLGMIRRRKEDVLKDLPDKVWKSVPCELTDPDLYAEAAGDFKAYLMKIGNAKALKAEKLTRVGHLLRLAARLKFRTPVMWANQFLSQTDEKLIMFAIHHKAVDVLQRRVEFKSVKLDGSVTGRHRQAAIDQFKNDPTTRLFIGSAAAGTGVNGLQHVASEMAITEFPHRPGDLDQWVGRAHRIGQTKPVFVNLFVAVDTIEADLVRLLREKQKNISAILDGGEVPADIDIYEELLSTIEGRLM